MLYVLQLGTGLNANITGYQTLRTLARWLGINQGGGNGQSYASMQRVHGDRRHSQSFQREAHSYPVSLRQFNKCKFQLYPASVPSRPLLVSSGLGIVRSPHGRLEQKRLSSVPRPRQKHWECKPGDGNCWAILTGLRIRLLLAAISYHRAEARTPTVSFAQIL